MRRASFAVLLGGVLIARCPRPPSAQTVRVEAAPAPAPAQLPTAAACRAPDTFGFRVFGTFDASLMAASNTFKAELGTSTLTGPGVGGEAIQGHWFARIALS